MPGLRVVFPCLSAKGGLPVVGLVAPDVPVSAWVVPAAAAFLEPGVLVRSVVHYHVQHYPYAPLVSACYQTVEIIQRPKTRIDRLVIADIVAEVFVWRGIERREPDGIDPQFVQVIQPAGDAGQVAQPIPVSVSKRARVDLVNHPVAPPQEIIHIALPFSPVHHISTAPIPARCPGNGLRRAPPHRQPLSATPQDVGRNRRCQRWP